MSHLAIVLFIAFVALAAGVIVGGLLIIWAVESALRGANL